jgi:hypothetical protein
MSVKFRVLFSGLICLFLSFSLAFGQEALIQEMAGGKIDWGDQLVIATGIGAPNPRLSPAQQRTSALTAARIDAQRRLLEIIKGANLTAETVVNNSMLESDIIRTTVEGTIRGFRQAGAPRYIEDGTVEIDVEVALSGRILGAVLPSTGSKQTEYESKEIPSNPSSSYTGMIVDCRGLNVLFALAPRVLNELGEEVYGPDWVDRDVAAETGVVGYYASDEDCRTRAGDNPFMVKALRSAGSNNCDAIIPNVDGTVLSSTEENLMFMDQCKVAFWVD